MADLPQLSRKIRAPRVNLWGNVSATIQLENGRQVWAKTLRISTTGGLLELPNCIDEGLRVSLTVHMNSRPVRGRAAMLFPTCASQVYLQPFRFTDLRDEESIALQSEIHQLLKQARLSARERRGFGLRPARFFHEST